MHKIFKTPKYSQMHSAVLRLTTSLGAYLGSTQQSHALSILRLVTYALQNGAARILSSLYSIDN